MQCSYGGCTTTSAIYVWYISFVNPVGQEKTSAKGSEDAAKPHLHKFACELFKLSLGQLLGVDGDAACMEEQTTPIVVANK